MCVTGGVPTKPSTAASSWTTNTNVGVRPPTVDVMTVAHVVVAHTPFSRCFRSHGCARGQRGLVLVAGKYPAANHNPSPIKQPRVLEVYFTGLLQQQPIRRLEGQQEKCKQWERAHREEKNKYFSSFIRYSRKLCVCVCVSDTHAHVHAVITVLSECCCRTNTNRRISVTAKAPSSL